MASTSVNLHLRPTTTSKPTTNPLPQVLQTPSGLAILELQGTINVPQRDGDNDQTASDEGVSIGRIDFPEYSADPLDPSSTAWMKRVYMFVGQHQRLTGEVKKLPRPIAIIRRRENAGEEVEMRDADGDEGAEEVKAEELEVVEIVKYKIVFSSRPEPVGTQLVG